MTRCACRTRLPQHIATNLLFTHRDGFAVDLETTPLDHRWGYAADGVLVHGNHYRYGIPPALAGTYRPAAVDSLYRVPIIERGLAGAKDASDSESVRKVVQSTMSDHFGHPHGVCAHARENDSAVTPVQDHDVQPGRPHRGGVPRAARQSV